MKQPKDYLAKAKTWNFVMLILSGLALLIGLVSLPTNLNPKKETYDALGAAGKELYEFAKSPLSLGYTIVNLLLLIALIVLYFLANKKLAEGIVPPKYPYYVVLVWFVFSLMFTLVLTPKQTIEGVDLGIFTTITAVVSTLIQSIVPVMILVNLFKAEPEVAE